MSDPVLDEHRRILRDEMRLVLDCETVEQKRWLYESWKRNYSPTMVETLVRCARDRAAAAKIAGWDLINWKRKE